MESTIFEGLKITAKCRGEKAAPWPRQKGMPINYNHHHIHVRNVETGERTRFDFWCSLWNPIIENEKDLLSAMECIVSDAIAGDMFFEEFCCSLGYDEDSRKDYKLYLECCRLCKKLQRVYSGSLYELSEKLQDNTALIYSNE